MWSGISATTGMHHVVPVGSREVSVGDAPASSEIAVQVPETPAQVDCPDFEFRREGIHLEEVIGNGFYGQVVKAKSDGILEGESTTVAVKILKGHASTTDFKNELAIFRALEKHPFVVSFLGSCTEKEPFYMIMEYVPNGTLEAFITRKRLAWTETRLTGLMKEAMNPLRILLFGFQIASGMEYLSSKHLVHRDLATRNVLLDEGLTCKLCDFGLARDVKGIGQYTQKSGNAIPFRWLALECIRDSIYTTKSDVWSFGVLMWELMTLGAQPYTDMSFEAMVVYLLGGFRLPRPAHCGEEIYVLMSECWTTEPEFRPSFTDLRQRLDCLLKLDSKLMDMSQFTSDVYLYQNPLVQTYLLGEA
ncbi:tyrosine kinase receptor Cad96Ca-like [Acanthaster planci]|uniref:Tyrosine kinase receptor Cad96Ca-like n=1 Tax=Acanthaster planci TaxID=133434 RepID=A0A8B7XVE5_ACAPL|nr:tyrosine kinase receptor Cad96Ca-like [Acanthaster planci]